MKSLNRQSKIDQITKEMNLLKKDYLKYLELEKDLINAKNSFDIGENVKVILTCKRGCCIENEFEGKIISLTKNGGYNIQDYNNHIHQYIFSGDMKRI